MNPNFDLLTSLTRWLLPVVVGASLMTGFLGARDAYRAYLLDRDAYDVDCYGSARYQAMSDNLPTCQELATAEIERRRK